MADGLGAPTWLITGASGFLGANLGLFLKGRARRIGCTRANGSTEFFDAIIGGDLVRPQAIADEIITMRPSVVVNAAAIADHGACERDPERAMQVNGVAPGVLADAASQVGALFLQISTDAVFNGSTGLYSEQDDTGPFSAYGRTKLAGEHAVLSAGDGIVVRTNFFGWSPRGHRSILEFFVTELSEGRRVTGFTDFTVTSMYVQQLCATLWRLCQLDARGVIHVASSDALTKYEFGLATAEEFGLDPALIVPGESDISPSRKRNLSLDVHGAEALLGHTLPTQREGLATAHADMILRQALRDGGRP